MGQLLRKPGQERVVLERTMTSSKNPTTPSLLPLLWYPHNPLVTPSSNHFSEYYIIMYFPFL